MRAEVFLHFISQDDREFRDKITPISVVMEYSLDYQQAADQTGLLPIVDISAPTNVTKQVTPLSLLYGWFSFVCMFAL